MKVVLYSVLLSLLLLGPLRVLLLGVILYVSFGPPDFDSRVHFHFFLTLYVEMVSIFDIFPELLVNRISLITIVWIKERCLQIFWIASIDILWELCADIFNSLYSSLDILLNFLCFLLNYFYFCCDRRSFGCHSRCCFL